jgi:hypothetical protein
VRITTAQSAPAPADFIAQLLQHLNPQLAGPEGATAAELAAVFAALAGLGYCPDEAWLAQALDGVAGTAVCIHHMLSCIYVLIMDFCGTLELACMPCVAIHWR